jgi:hypothetical protein
MPNQGGIVTDMTDVQPYRPPSLARIAEIIRRDLQDDRERDAKRLIFGFADGFRSADDKAALIADEPSSTGDLGFDAALAGTAEYFAREAGLPSPEWTDGPGRFAEPWWFWAPRPVYHAYVLARTPAPFFRHGVFIAEEVFTRV